MPAIAAITQAAAHLVHPHDRNGKVTACLALPGLAPQIWREALAFPRHSRNHPPTSSYVLCQDASVALRLVCASPTHPPARFCPRPYTFEQLDGSFHATHGLQSALDDYRRACHEAAAAVRHHLRQLARDLQVGGCWPRCRAGRAGLLQGCPSEPAHIPEAPARLLPPLQVLQTQLVCAAGICVAAAALTGHTREALRCGMGGGRGNGVGNTREGQVPGVQAAPLAGHAWTLKSPLPLPLPWGATPNCEGAVWQQSQASRAEECWLAGCLAAWLPGCFTNVPTLPPATRPHHLPLLLAAVQARLVPAHPRIRWHRATAGASRGSAARRVCH